MPWCGPKLRMDNGIGERSSRGRRLVISATSRCVFCILVALCVRLGIRHALLASCVVDC